MISEEFRKRLESRLKSEEEMLAKARKHEDLGTANVCKEMIRKIKFMLKE